MINISINDIPCPPEDFKTGGNTYSEKLQNWQEWISKFDNLPYLKKNQIGTSTVGNYPIFEYQFGAEEGVPVLITSCIHGAERRPVSSTYWLAYCLCNASTPLFEEIKKYINLRIVPFGNPWGFIGTTYISGGRKNGRDVTEDPTTFKKGVDINRNFDWRWGANQNEESTTFCGASPFSENETKAIRDRMISSEDMNNPLLYIDCHDTGNITHKKITLEQPNYQLSQNREISDILVNLADKVVKQIDPLSGVTRDYPKPRYLSSSPMSVNYAASQGITAFGLEAHNTLWNPDQTIADKNMVRAYVTTICTAIHGVCSGLTSPLPHHYTEQNLYLGVYNRVFDSRESYSNVIGPGLSGDNDKYAWSYYGDNKSILSANPAQISIPYTSDVILQVVGDVRLVHSTSDASGRVIMATWLDKIDNTEAGLADRKAYTANIDIPTTGKYYQIGPVYQVYHNVSEGLYKVRAAVWQYKYIGNAENVTSRYIRCFVRVLPSIYMEPSYCGPCP